MICASVAVAVAVLALAGPAAALQLDCARNVILDAFEWRSSSDSVTQQLLVTRGASSSRSWTAAQSESVPGAGWRTEPLPRPFCLDQVELDGDGGPDGGCVRISGRGLCPGNLTVLDWGQTVRLGRACTARGRPWAFLELQLGDPGSDGPDQMRTSWAVVFESDHVYGRSGAPDSATGQQQALFDWLRRFDCANMSAVLLTESSSPAITSITSRLRTTVAPLQSSISSSPGAFLSATSSLASSLIAPPSPSYTTMTTPAPDGPENTPDPPQPDPSKPAPSSWPSSPVAGSGPYWDLSDPLILDCTEVVLFEAVAASSSGTRQVFVTESARSNASWAPARVGGGRSSAPAPAWASTADTDLRCPDPDVVLYAQHPSCLAYRGTMLCAGDQYVFDDGVRVVVETVCLRATDPVLYYRLTRTQTVTDGGQAVETETRASMVYGTGAAWARRRWPMATDPEAQFDRLMMQFRCPNATPAARPRLLVSVLALLLAGAVLI